MAHHNLETVNDLEEHVYDEHVDEVVDAIIDSRLGISQIRCNGAKYNVLIDADSNRFFEGIINEYGSRSLHTLGGDAQMEILLAFKALVNLRLSDYEISLNTKELLKQIDKIISEAVKQVGNQHDDGHDHDYISPDSDYDE